MALPWVWGVEARYVPSLASFVATVFNTPASGSEGLGSAENHGREAEYKEPVLAAREGLARV